MAGIDALLQVQLPRQMRPRWCSADIGSSCATAPIECNCTSEAPAGRVRMWKRPSSTGRNRKGVQNRKNPENPDLRAQSAAQRSCQSLRCRRPGSLWKAWRSTPPSLAPCPSPARISIQSCPLAPSINIGPIVHKMRRAAPEFDSNCRSFKGTMDLRQVAQRLVDVFIVVHRGTRLSSHAGVQTKALGCRNPIYLGRSHSASSMRSSSSTQTPTC